MYQSDESGESDAGTRMVREQDSLDVLAAIRPYISIEPARCVAAAVIKIQYDEPLAHTFFILTTATPCCTL